MASIIWRRLVIRPFAPYASAYRRSKAIAARRLLRARWTSAMRWRASSRLRARIDFALTVKKYHASRPRKAPTWKAVAGEARGGEVALQGKHYSWGIA